MAPPGKDLLEWWRPKLRALDPWREVGLGEIHELYAERQRAPYRSLATNLRLANHPSEVKIILCGALGCGKTTELTRLAHDVERDFCVVNVPVWRREENGGVVHEPEGISVLRDLYQRRRTEAGFPESLFDEQLIEQAAKNCAGIVRDFLRLLEEAGKNALNRGAYTASRQDLEIAIKTLRLEMEGFLDEQDLRILRRVLDKGTLPASPEADTLLFGNFIACYHNGDIWFRPHELIVEFIRAQRADL